MKPLQSLPFFSISYFFPLTVSAHAAPQPAAEPDVANLALGPRADAVSTLTLFTPSPGADPIPITSQSQLVTSYVPILTICPLIPFIPSLPTPATNTTLPPSAPAPSASALPRRQPPPSPAPYTNTSIPTSYLSSCSISYTPTPTLICHTTLSPLASPSIPITDCTQQVTFSTDHGYTLLPPLPNNTQAIADLTTYYAARWDVLTAGVPTEGIRKEVCSAGGCATEWEAWSLSTGWVPEISTVTVGPPVRVTGPALVMLHPALPTWTVPAGQTKRIGISTEVVAARGRAVVGIRSRPTSMGMGGGDASGVGGGGESTTTSTHTGLVTRVVTVQRAGGGGDVSAAGGCSVMVR